MNCQICPDLLQRLLRTNHHKQLKEMLNLESKSKIPPSKLKLRKFKLLQVTIIYYPEVVADILEKMPLQKYNLYNYILLLGFHSTDCKIQCSNIPMFTSDNVMKLKYPSQRISFQEITK